MLGSGLGRLRADTFQNFADSRIPCNQDASVYEDNARTRIGDKSVWAIIRDQALGDKRHSYNQNHSEVTHIDECAPEAGGLLTEQSFGSTIVQMSSASFKSAETTVAKGIFSSGASSPGDILAFWENFRQLVDALFLLHGHEELNHNIHSSVKPENILYVPWNVSISELPAQTSSLREDFGDFGRQESTEAGSTSEEIKTVLREQWVCTCKSSETDLVSTIQEQIHLNAQSNFSGNTVSGGRNHFGHVFHTIQEAVININIHI